MASTESTTSSNAASTTQHGKRYFAQASGVALHPLLGIAILQSSMRIACMSSVAMMDTIEMTSIGLTLVPMLGPKST